MSPYSDSVERRPGDFFKFALGFVGFMMAAGGVVISSPAVALLGTAILLLAILGFRSRPYER